jgi:hypothetical protein
MKGTRCRIQDTGCRMQEIEQLSSIADPNNEGMNE